MKERERELHIRHIYIYMYIYGGRRKVWGTPWTAVAECEESHGGGHVGYYIIIC